MRMAVMIGSKRYDFLHTAGVNAGLKHDTAAGGCGCGFSEWEGWRDEG